jgi:Fe-S-cluster containining protein
MAGSERYDCSRCPGYCCSYRLIPVTDRDLSRLAEHFSVTTGEASKRFTRVVDGELALRTRRDRIYASICMFFDQAQRCCSIYEARPEICRKHPGGRRCGYYDRLLAEREARDDETYVPEARGA